MTDLAGINMGAALVTLLEESESFTTLEIIVNILRPVSEGEIYAEGRVIHRGRTVALIESVLENSEQKGRKR